MLWSQQAPPRQRWPDVSCPPGEVKGDLKKGRLLNKAGHKGLVGTYPAEVGGGEEKELCSNQRDQHVQKLRGESAK